MNAKEMVAQMAQALEDKKAVNITVLNIGGMTVIADYFLIASGLNNIHIKSLCDELEERLAAQGIQPRRRDGYTAGRWVVLDYGDVIVHIFHPEEREFYNLERLWADAPQEDWSVS